MTSQKHLKALVRARMAKTGERYTAARAHVIAATAPKPAPDTAGQAWDLRGGVHADTASFANVLANLGVTAPGGGDPLSEALVLGVGGGLGAGYILWEFERHDARILTLGFRNQWQYPARWAAKTADRLGLHAEIRETGSVRQAAAQLDGTLDRGLPAIVWVDAQTLGHRHLPDWLDGLGSGPLVVYGSSGDRQLVDDRSSGRLSVSRAVVSDARARVVSYKNRSIEIDPALVEIDGERLRAAMREGIADQVAHLRARSDSFSLPAWRKWARMVTDTRNRKSWPNVFTDRRGLASALVSIYENAGPAGTHGGNLRSLYADFLDEAATWLDAPALAAEVGTRFRAAASAWDAVVDTAVPPGDGAFGTLRALVDESAGSIAAGDAAAPAAARSAAQRWELQSRLDREAPLGDAELDDLLERLGECVSAVYEIEAEAVEALAEVAPAG